MAKNRSGNKKARVLSSKLAFRGPLFNVVTESVLEPSGFAARRDIVRHPGSVVILAIDGHFGSPRVLLERQYRHAASGNLWELPAGKIDQGETELAAAKRELSEETGYTALHWKRVLRFYVSPGFLDETMAVYLAQGIKPGRRSQKRMNRSLSGFFL